MRCGFGSWAQGRMSNVIGDKHRDGGKCRLMSALSLSLMIVAAACDARPTGSDDVLAVTHSKPNNGHVSHTDTGAANASDNDAAGNDGDDLADAGKAGAAGGGHDAKDPRDANDGSGGKNSTSDVGITEPPLPPAATSDDEPRKPVLFWVDLVGNRVYRANADGTERQAIGIGQAIASPDGVTVDLDNGFVYWTNMGTLIGGGNIGTLQRMKLGAGTVETVVPIGTTNTPKQIAIDNEAGKLYWCDREGAKVWRAALDGSDPEVLVSGHGVIQLVGMGLDLPKRQFYFSDRMARKIYRASFDMPEGQTAENRTDVETLFSFAGASMPLDLDLDLDQRKIYWSDRVRGTILRSNMDMPSGATAETRMDTETLVENLVEPIGVSLDRVQKQLYFTQLGGEVSRVDLDGSHLELVVATGSASGVTLTHLPAK
jgi:sugar lactone lactonase YvrE